MQNPAMRLKITCLELIRFLGRYEEKVTWIVMQVWTVGANGSISDRLPVQLPINSSGTDTSGLLTDIVLKVAWLPGIALHQTAINPSCRSGETVTAA